MDFHRIRKLVQTQHTLHDHEWEGAVVFLFNQDYVFFIKRSEKMPTHGGQIAFVGGHKHDGEKDPWESARREFEEETGFNSSEINFLGYLPVVLTARMRPIVPVLSELLISTDAFFEKVVSNGEWDEVIAYPWRELVKEENWEYAWRNGFTKHAVLFHPIKAGTFRPHRGELTSHLLWGATASIVWDLLRLYYQRSSG